MKKSGQTSASSAQMQMDLSILRPPIAPSVTGLLDVIKAFKNGTSEIRHILSYECELIYECKVCRNIFRSLMHFITHKRAYCKEKNDSSQHSYFQPKKYNDEDVIHIDDSGYEEAGGSFKSTNHHGKSKDTSGSSILASSLTRPIDDRRESKQQTATSRSSSVKTEVDAITKKFIDSVTAGNDVRKMSHGIETMKLEEDRKLNTIEKLKLKLDGDKVMRIETNKSRLTCDVCKRIFLNEEMLMLHKKVLHAGTVYKCPSCTKTFSLLTNMRRHLRDIHKYSNRKMRSMREAIYVRKVKEPTIAISDSEEVTVQEVKEIPMPEVGCAHCGKLLKSQSLLDNHILVCDVKLKMDIEKAAKLQSEKSRLPPKLRMRLNLLSDSGSSLSSLTAVKPVVVPQQQQQQPLPVSEVIAVLAVPVTVSTQPAPIANIQTKIADIAPATQPQTRPIRNRIKKNHKDFIYDLPTIASMTSLNPMKTSRRRNTIQDIVGPSPKKQAILSPPAPLPQSTPPPNLSTSSKFAKAAFRMANLVVDRSRAQFKTHPKLKSQNLNAILPLSRRQSVRCSGLDDFHSENGFSNNAVEFNNEFGSPTHSSNSSDSNVFPSVKCPTEKEFKQYLESNRLSEPVKKILLVTPELAANTK